MTASMMKSLVKILSFCAISLIKKIPLIIEFSIDYTNRIMITPIAKLLR